MGNLAHAVFSRGPLTAAMGRDREGDEAGRPIAIGRTGFTQRRSNDKRAIQDGATASLVIAARWQAKHRGSTAMLPRADLDNDVSILITATVQPQNAGLAQSPLGLRLRDQMSV
jgi:hypothetical protein